MCKTDNKKNVFPLTRTVNKTDAAGKTETKVHVLDADKVISQVREAGIILTGKQPLTIRKLVETETSKPVDQIRSIQIVTKQKRAGFEAASFSLV